MSKLPWRIGLLAERTGITIRTLRYYDEIGLLTPSRVTQGGQRLYGKVEIQRLHQILALRQLGFPLEEIRDCLVHKKMSTQEVVALHLTRLRQQLAQTRKLCKRMEHIAAQMKTMGEPSVDFLLQIIEVTRMLDKYYSPEQQKELRERAEALGPEGLRQKEKEWETLIQEVGEAMKANADPASERVQALAKRWNGLIEEFTGGNPAIRQSLGNLYKQEPGVANRFGSGLEPGMFAFISKATEAGGKPGGTSGGDS